MAELFVGSLPVYGMVSSSGLNVSPVLRALVGREVFVRELTAASQDAPEVDHIFFVAVGGKVASVRSALSAQLGENSVQTGCGLGLIAGPCSWKHQLRLFLGSSLGKGLDLFEDLVGDQLDIVLTYFDWVLLSASATLSGFSPGSELGKTAHVARLGKSGVALRGVG